MKDWDIQINYGIKTGFNDAFIISTEKRNEILSNCKDADERKRTEELIRPILRGRDIKRYEYNWAGLWLIATFPSRHYNIEDYPAVKTHLLSIGKERLEQTGKSYVINGEKIKSRKKTNNKWFETQDSIGYWEDFFRPKIVYPNMTKYLPFVYDKDGYFTNQKCFIALTTTPAYLTSFFNSQLFKAIYKDLFPSLGEDRRELGKIYMEKVIVKQIDKDVEEFFANLVKAIQTKYSDELDKQLNKKIFSLYELTDSEIEWVLINNYT